MTLTQEILYHSAQTRQWIDWTTGTRWGSLDEVYHHARLAAHYALLVLGRPPVFCTSEHAPNRVNALSPPDGPPESGR